MFRITETAIDAEALKADLADHGAGACATFEGWVRAQNEGKAVESLAYEAYSELAEKEGGRILEEARTRFGLLHAVCVHRTGHLALGDMAVLVGVSAPHRGEAFAACRYIIDEVKHRVPIWKKEWYADGDSGWVNCERCAAHGHMHAHAAPAIEPETFYSRQTVLTQVGAEGQAMLAAARVLIVGAGGLGCPAAMYLAGAGVGVIGLCDGDRVEASNLHRQPLFAFGDVGKPKARVAAGRIEALNPFVRATVHETRLTAANAREIVSGYDLILDCTDNFETKYLINDAAVLFDKPYVMASVYQFEGHVFAYDPARESACLRCIWPAPPAAGCIGSCAEAGVLGAVPGIAGALQAMEALKRLLDLPGRLDGELLLCDFLSGSQQRIRAARRTDCSACGATRSIRITAEDTPLELEVERVLQEAPRYRVFDIRELEETLAKPLPGLDAEPAPGSAWNLDAPPIDREQDVVLCCARGMRSLSLARALRQRGYGRVYSLRGGAGALL